MKRIAIFLMCIFGTMSVAFAQQGFKMSVQNDIEEPLPHAYIYVNGRAVAVADTLGRAVIPQDKLKIGDSISVSYVATEGGSIIFDQDLKIKGEYNFVLQEIYGALLADAVVVKAKLDVKKLYRKHVKRRIPVENDNIWCSDFSINISKPEGSIRTVTGKMKVAFVGPYNIAYHLDADSTVLDSIKKRYGTIRTFRNQLPLEITTSDDTTGLSYALKYFMPDALSVNRDVLIKATNPEPNWWTPSNTTGKYIKITEIYPDAAVTYNYLGKDEHHRIFRLTYSGFQPGITRQIVVKSDMKSGDIREITQHVMNLNTGNASYFNAKIDKTKNRYFPIELEYRIESNSEELDVTMKNINIQPLGKPKEKLEQTIRRMMRTGKLE